tara:strand:- start:564 stop:785 length:222 start_codon:yes stop_codon:yes gene_type:complete
MPNISYEELAEAYNNYLNQYRSLYCRSNIIKQDPNVVVMEAEASDMQTVSRDRPMRQTRDRIPSAPPASSGGY